MMNHRKITSLILVAAVLATPLSGCSKNDKTAKAEKAAEETVTGYCDNLIAGKIDKNNELVVNGDDKVASMMSTAEYPSLIEAILLNSSYEIIESDISTDSGKGDITVSFTTIDVSSLLTDSGLIPDEETFIGTINDVAGDERFMVTEELTIKVKEVDEDWLITGKGTEAFADYLLSLIDGIHFSKVSEDEAVDYVSEYFDLLVAGDLDGAAAMTDPTAELIPDNDATSTELASLYLSRITDISCESVNATYEWVTVSVSATAPNINEVAQSVAVDEAFFSAVMAETIYAGVNNLDVNSYLDETCGDLAVETFTHALDQASTTNFSWEGNVIRDESGDLYISSDTEVMPDISDIDYTDAFMTQCLGNAIESLHNDGRVDDDTLAELYSTTFGAYPDWYGQNPDGLGSDGLGPDEFYLPTSATLIHDPDACPPHEADLEPYTYTESEDLSKVIFETADSSDDLIQGPFDEINSYNIDSDCIILHIVTKNPHSIEESFIYDVYRDGEYVGSSNVRPYLRFDQSSVISSDLYIFYVDPNSSDVQHLSQGDYTFVIHNADDGHDSILTTVGIDVYVTE